MEKHDLHHEFPEYDELIHELKMSNHHFKKLFDEYHSVNKSIINIETNQVYTDDELKQLRVHRLFLKDALLNELKQHQIQN